MFSWLSTAVAIVAMASSVFAVPLEATDHKLVTLDGKAVRIMAIGDERTGGRGAKDKKGYRGHLDDLLDEAGANVTWIGREIGPDVERRVNGHTRNYIEEQTVPGMAQAAINALSSLSKYGQNDPNVFLIFAGFRDVYLHPSNVSVTGPFKPQSTPGAPPKREAVDALIDMIDSLRQRVPTALIAVANLPLDTPYNGTADASRWNDHLKAYFRIRTTSTEATKGRPKSRLVQVNFQRDVGFGRINKMPTAQGYQEMANRWYRSLADDVRLLVPPQLQNSTQLHNQTWSQNQKQF